MGKRALRFDDCPAPGVQQIPQPYHHDPYTQPCHTPLMATIYQNIKRHFGLIHIEEGR